MTAGVLQYTPIVSTSFVIETKKWRDKNVSFDGERESVWTRCSGWNFVVSYANNRNKKHCKTSFHFIARSSRYLEKSFHLLNIDFSIVIFFEFLFSIPNKNFHFYFRHSLENLRSLPLCSMQLHFPIFHFHLYPIFYFLFSFNQLNAEGFERCFASFDKTLCIFTMARTTFVCLRECIHLRKITFFLNVSFSFIFMTFYETRARSTIMNNLVEVSLMAQWKKMLLVRRQSSHTGLSSLSLNPIICLVEWNVTSLMKMKVIWLRSVGFLWCITWTLFERHISNRWK